METSGEIGERVVVTIGVTIVMDFTNHYLIMVAHEDCVSKAGVEQRSWQPLISRDCAVEAG